MLTQNRRFAAIMLTSAALLLIPFIAMQFTNEVAWDGFDFAVAGVLLLGTGLVLELVLRVVKPIKYRLILCGVIFVVLFLVWAELAVGIFGTPFAGS